MGLAGGTLLSLPVLVPLLVWQYRHYGRLTVPRLLGALAVSLYAAGLFAYTLLPLPVPAELDCTAATVAWAMLVHVTGWKRPGHTAEVLVTVLLPGLLWIVVPALSGTRASAGQKTVWLAPALPDADDAARAASLPPRTVSAGQALARAASVGGVYVVGRTAEALLPATAAGLLSLLMGLWLLVAVVSVVATRNHRGLSCAVTGLELVDARTLAARQPRGRDAR